MKHYDFLFAGGGLAGLSLAYHLLQSPLRSHTMLIVDQHPQSYEDRTWGFWAHQTTPFDNIVYRSWNRLQVLDEQSTKLLSLRTYRYQAIRGCDFSHFLQQKLADHPNVEFLQGTVEQIEDGNNDASLLVEGHCYHGQWIFDNRFQWSAADPLPAHYAYLKQQFKGWEIETDESIFDPQTVTLFDWRISQGKEGSFFYILPFSEYHALVMFVIYTKVAIGWEKCDSALQDYLQTALGTRAYRLLRTEQGITLLTDQPFPRRSGQHVMTIGKTGGRVKPSTGYAFSRIQQDSAAIVDSLLRTGHPFQVTPSPLRYRFFDAVLLHSMSSHKEQRTPLLKAILMRQPIERMLRFLDEIGSHRENLLMVPALPPLLTIQMLLQAPVLLRM
jgi:lycopene beta-cyclase